MSGSKGVIRKYYDKGPAAITSNGNYDGSGSPTTLWSVGTLGPAFGNVLWLTDLQQSDDDSGRIGQSVALETFDFRIQITPQPTVVGYQSLRMIIASDNECDGAAPTLLELLGPTATTVATGLQMSFLNPGYFGRFHIIEDKRWHLYVSSTANSFTESETHPFIHESHHDMRSHRVMWDATDASLIANARKGHIFLFFVYENTVTATGGLPTVTTANPPSIQYTCRFRFRDA